MSEITKYEKITRRCKCCDNKIPVYVDEDVRDNLIENGEYRETCLGCLNDIILKRQDVNNIEDSDYGKPMFEDDTDILYYEAEDNYDGYYDSDYDEEEEDEEDEDYDPFDDDYTYDPDEDGMYGIDEDDDDY